MQWVYKPDSVSRIIGISVIYLSDLPLPAGKYTQQGGQPCICKTKFTEYRNIFDLATHEADSIVHRCTTWWALTPPSHLYPHVTRTQGKSFSSLLLCPHGHLPHGSMVPYVVWTFLPDLMTEATERPTAIFLNQNLYQKLVTLF